MGATYIIKPGNRERRRRRKRSAAAPSWENTRREDSGGGGKHFREFVFFGVIATLVAAIPVWMYFVPSPETEKLPETPALEAKTVTTEVSPFSPPLEPSEKSDQAIAALLAFVNATDNRIRSQYVIGRLAMCDTLEDYYGKFDHKVPARIINPAVSSVETGGREIVIVSFVDENGRTNAAPFEWDADAYHLHWEAFVGYGEIPLQKFFSSRPKGEFKVRVKLFIPENQVDGDGAKKDITALVSHPDLPSPGFVRVPVDSVAFQRLSRLPPGTDVPALITIRWPKNVTEPSLPVLSGWIHRDWIRP